MLFRSGPADVVWDLRDASGRRVRPGLYMASARFGLERSTRPILVMR